MKHVFVLLSSFAFFSSTLYAAEPADDFADIPEFKVQPLTQPILKQLRKGGYVLYMRHGSTDTSRPDQPNIDLNDCSTQRMLSDEGRRIVKGIGLAIRKANIPLGDIHASPMCRVKDTAQLTFGKNNITLNNKLMYTANMTDTQKLHALETIRELVSNPVPGKANRVVVAHSQNIMALMGYLPSPEGAVLIMQPLGDKQFKYIATVKPDQWKHVQP